MTRLWSNKHSTLQQPTAAVHSSSASTQTVLSFCYTTAVLLLLCCCLLLRNDLIEYPNRQRFLGSRLDIFFASIRIRLYLVSTQVSTCCPSCLEFPSQNRNVEMLYQHTTLASHVIFACGEMTVDGEAVWSNKHRTQQRKCASSPFLLLYNCCRCCCRCCLLLCND